MSTVTSADGTTIAYEHFGDGPPVVIVGGATNLKEFWFELAQALAAAGFTGVSYDRRGRGGSGDTRPYAVEREIEDLAAVIDAVGAPTGAPVGVHGISSGGALCYRAVAAGLPIRTMSALETPYRVGDGAKPPPTYIEDLERLYAADDREAMLEYFLANGAGMPPDAIAGMKQQPIWQALAAIGQTVLYDGYCLGGSQAPLPTDLLAKVRIPVLSVASTGSAPFLVDAARAAADALPQGGFVELEGEFHNVPTSTLAPVLAEHHA